MNRRIVSTEWYGEEDFVGYAPMQLHVTDIWPRTRSKCTCGCCINNARIAKKHADAEVVTPAVSPVQQQQQQQVSIVAVEYDDEFGRCGVDSDDDDGGSDDNEPVETRRRRCGRRMAQRTTSCWSWMYGLMYY